MGMRSSADVFYGVAWDLEDELGEGMQAIVESDDAYEELEQLLKDESLGHLLEVDAFGNFSYETAGYSVAVRGTQSHGSIGEAREVGAQGSISSEALVALEKVLGLLGREGAKVGWLMTVSYG